MAEIRRENIILDIEARSSKLDADIDRAANKIESLETQATKTSGGVQKAFDNASKSTGNYDKSLKGVQDQQKRTSTSSGILQRALRTLDNALGGAITRITNLISGLKGIQGGFAQATSAIGVFVRALAVSGVGAFIFALGALVLALKRTQDGAEFASTAMGAFRQAVGFTLDTVGNLGLALVALFSGQFKKAADIATDALSNFIVKLAIAGATGAASQERLNELFRQETAFLVEKEKLLAKESELKADIFDRDVDIATRRRALTELEATQEQRLGKQLEIAKERLSIEKSSLLNSNNLDKAKRVLAELEAEIFRIENEGQRVRKENLTILKQLNAEAKERKETEEEIEEIITAQKGSLTELLRIQGELNKIAQDTASTSDNFYKNIINLAKAIKAAGLEQEEFNRLLKVAKDLLDGAFNEIETIPSEPTRELNNELKGLEATIKRLQDNRLGDITDAEKNKIAIEQIKENAVELIRVSAAISEAFARDETNRLDGQVRRQEERVRRFQILAEQGATNQLILEEERLNKLYQLREQAAQRERQLAALEITAANAVSVAKAIQAVISGFQSGNFLTGIANSIALAATIGATILAVKNATASIPAFFEGTEYLQRNGAPKGKDKILVRANEGERIVPTKENRLLTGISNKDLPYYANLGKALQVTQLAPIQKTDNYDAIVHELQGVKNQIRKIKQTVYVDRYGIKAGLDATDREQKRRRNLAR